MTDKIVQIAQKVRNLLGGDNSGHGFDHVERVWQTARELAAGEPVDMLIVEAAALLHDADDYKLFGADCAAELRNTRQILNDCGIDEKTAAKVCEVVANMGYSKLLAGIRPSTPEGWIVSDADMLDAIGANGLVRTLNYAFMRCLKYGKPIWDREVWPEIGLTSEQYKKADRRSDNCINHFFEKLLRLKDLMLTAGGRRLAAERQEFMIMFLKAFFTENYAPDWLEYLETYLQGLKASAKADNQFRTENSCLPESFCVG